MLVSHPAYGDLTMKRLALIVVPLFLLAAAACADQLVTAPQEALSSTDESSETTYDILALSPLSGHSSSWGVDINDANVIVGTSWGSGQSPDCCDSRIFRWVDGVVEDIGDGEPHGINNTGAVVAWTREENGRPLSVLRDDHQEFLSLSAGGWWRADQMINDAGTVAGRRVKPDEDGNLWQDGTAVWHAGDGYSLSIPLGLPADCDDLPEDRNCSSPDPWAINSNGDVVGDFLYSYDGGWYRIAAIWFAGDYDNPIWLQRGTWGNRRIARGVNDAGWIVGSVRTERAAVWIPGADGEYGAATELPHFQDGSTTGRAQAVSEPDGNGTVRIVGVADDRPALWIVTHDGQISGPVNLGTPSRYNRGEARAINSNGWILGHASSNRSSVAVIWRPQQPGGGDDDDDEKDPPESDPEPCVRRGNSNNCK